MCFFPGDLFFENFRSNKKCPRLKNDEKEQGKRRRRRQKRTRILKRRAENVLRNSHEFMRALLQGQEFTACKRHHRRGRFFLKELFFGFPTGDLPFFSPLPPEPPPLLFMAAFWPRLSASIRLSTDGPPALPLWSFLATTCLICFLRPLTSLFALA